MAILEIRKHFSFLLLFFFFVLGRGVGGSWGSGDGVLGFFGVAYYLYNLLKIIKLVHTSFKVDYDIYFIKNY